MTEPCKWCGAPAVDTIEIEPAKYATVAKTDPMTGEVLRGQECTQLPITAPVCAAHLTIGEGPGGEIKTPRKTRAPGTRPGENGKDPGPYVPQGLFDLDDNANNAIYGADQ